jgi:hypothetical protein
MPLKSTKDEADTRLCRSEPLTADEARAVYPWLNALHHHLPRIQMDLALQQIEAIERFNTASAKQTRVGVWLVGLQTLVAIVAVAISVISLLHAH